MEEQTPHDAAEERYGQQIAVVLAEMREILDGRSMCALRGAEAAQYQAARTRLCALVMAQRRMAGKGEDI
jgi:hypothetical protein